MGQIGVDVRGPMDSLGRVYSFIARTQCPLGMVLSVAMDPCESLCVAWVAGGHLSRPQERARRRSERTPELESDPDWRVSPRLNLGFSVIFGIRCRTSGLFNI